MSDPPPSRLAQLRPTADRLLPIGTRRRDTAGAAYQFLKAGRRLGADSAELLREAGRVAVAGANIAAATGVALPDEPYPLWLARHRASRADRQAQARISATARHPVTVAVVTVAGAGEEQAATATRRSLDHQTWRHHTEAVAPTGAEALTNAAAGDGRDFVVIAAAGDRFEPDWAFHIADTAWRDPAVDLVYWDDDLLGGGGFPTRPRVRPAWSPETLLGANYLGRSFAVRRRRLQSVIEATGLHATVEPHHDWRWRLLLGAQLQPAEVARVPRILAHLTSRHDTVGVAGLETVRGHLHAIGEAAEVEGYEGMARIRWQVEEWPLVSVVIPTRHNRALLERCLASLATTDYPAFEVLVVDNGGRSEERDRWYEQALPGVALRVTWWDEAFNYSAVNNAAASLAGGEVLVFLNDDTEAIDPGWLKEMVAWARRPDIGVVGMQLLDGEGRIQHGGVVLAMRGLAEHLFQGMAPGSPSLLGPTTWYRNMLAATGACLAISRSDFEAVGGFDERFVLCGSDVVLGLDAVGLGRRNVTVPFPMVRHYEGLTRSNFVPTGDVFASYWPYQRWIFGGDPYFSPHLSLVSPEPRLRQLGELTAAARLTKALGRNFDAYRQRDDEAETKRMAATCRTSQVAPGAPAERHVQTAGRLDVRTVNWFVPDIDSPFYGGISTALRIADHLARHHGVDNRFVLWAGANEPFIRSALAAAFPALASCPIFFHDSPVSAALREPPAADVAIATQWVTAYSVTNFAAAIRKAYLIQDFEPMFYPAGTLFALAEATYRMGLYGICNSPNLERLYRESYGGQGMAFTPAVDRNIFHATGRREQGRDGAGGPGQGRDEPTTVFLYSRPGHWRNCWELASVALAETKDRLGDRVRFVTAGSWARPADLGTGITHLGLLDYRATGALYRTCDIGIALTVSEHPSYLPLELMASGAAVIAFDKKPFSWLLRDGDNCLRVPLNVDGLVDGIVRLVEDEELRHQLAKQALADIDRDFSSWEAALGAIYDYLCRPEQA